jgi:chemotaxis methyl-accepting protein methylase
MEKARPEKVPVPFSAPRGEQTMLVMRQTPPPEMSSAEMALWRDYIMQRCGLTFSDDRCRLLRYGLDKRMRQKRVQSYADYYQYVAFGPNGADEWPALLDLLLNRETSFFRHPPSFEALTKQVLPDLLRDKHHRGENQIALWSAGCSKGQEPYSLAMSVLETINKGHWKVRIIGTDICPRTLARARLGQYQPQETKSLNEPYRSKYLRRPKTNGEVYEEVATEVRELVRFGFCNLIDLPSFPPEAHDVIFCQNVLIYFAPESRDELVRQLGERLVVGGYLFLGPSDAVGLQLPGMRPVHLENVLVYQRDK